MVELFLFLVTAAYAVTILQFAMKLEPKEIASKARSFDGPIASRVLILILLLPAIASSMLFRAGRDLFVWALFKADDALGDAPDAATEETDAQ